MNHEVLFSTLRANHARRFIAREGDASALGVAWGDVSLTIFIFTIDGAEKLAAIVPPLLDVADELVIGVDDASRDRSFDVARTFTEKVVSVPHALLASRATAIPFILPHCSGDWVLRIDHDETLSAHWSERGYVERLLSNRSVTHVWIPRRWILPPGDRFIASFPWQPDYQLRLFRNVPSLIQLSPELHGLDAVVGEPFFVTDAWINHLDFVWTDRAAREAKVRYYAERGVSNAEFYFYEEQSYETKPADWSPELPRFGAYEPSASPFHASLRLVDAPKDVYAASHATVLLSVRNDSSRSFVPGNGWSRDANVKAAYHWRALGSDVATSEHPRTPLPCRLEPGESTLLYLIVQTPAEPGRYTLQPDLIEEHVAWFSDHCAIEPLELIVRERNPDSARSVE